LQSQASSKETDAVAQINALALQREHEGYEANESVRWWHKAVFNRLKWAL
jgi:hypothetical protein